MPAKLVIIAGPNQGQTYPLTEGLKITIGRGDAANIRLIDSAVSRAHCTVEYTLKATLIKDVGSKSGTKVNGKAVTDQALVDGDIIYLGGTQIRFDIDIPAHHDDEEATNPEELRKLANTRLGHYEIHEAVAVGNSGLVFRATDAKEGREVALKVYLPEFAENEEDLQRFIRAVKTMLPMRHPNLVTLYGGGKTGPYCWMAMEYVEGESLTDTIARIGRKGKVDWRPAMHVALGLARGLYYIHNEKIIHRSLSPGNILFSKGGVPKLGSLILAKALSGALAKDVTVGGDFLGDVRYLAPEQVGAGGPVDGRADIYALGSLIYAMLTGKPPFVGKTQLETATWILRREAMPLRDIDEDIPQPLEKVVMKMLAKKPDERYQSAADVLMDLESIPVVDPKAPRVELEEIEE
ncbi:MAG TPA: FHA domain-containing serine/threonine-protein kinase [Gemmataceae bacterium]|nr:FHA domain-containing serine/threonine-protein kinase [Gemmataceae bacterium]